MIPMIAGITMTPVLGSALHHPHTKTLVEFLTKILLLCSRKRIMRPSGINGADTPISIALGSELRPYMTT